MSIMMEVEEISVMMCVRDSADYIYRLDSHFTHIEEICSQFVFKYFFYENDSKDQTKEALVRFFKHHDGCYVSEVKKMRKYGNEISNSRSNHMSWVRKHMQKHFKPLTVHSDYVLIMDCDVWFSSNTIINMIGRLKGQTKMISGYICEIPRFKLESKASWHYFDTLALKFSPSYDTEKFYNTCMVRDCLRCKLCRKRTLKFVDEASVDKNAFDVNSEPFSVESAFGSFSIVPAEIFSLCNWSPNDQDICEHFEFCRQVKSFGDIIIDPSIPLFMVQSWNGIETEELNCKLEKFEMIISGNQVT